MLRIKDKKFLTIILFSIFSLSTACNIVSVNTVTTSNQSSDNVSPINDEKKPKYWEEIYFESINEKLSDFQITSLQSKEIKNDDLEIRIWVGFDESELKGIILTKQSNNWTSYYLPQKSIARKKLIKVQKPVNGWNKFEKTLEENDFYNIPDISESKNNLYTDARCIVVEIKNSEKYRNFMQVQDADLKDNPELKSIYSIKLTNICKFIEKEFNLSLS